MVEEMMVQRIEELYETNNKLIEDGKYENFDHKFAYNQELGCPNSSPDAPVIQGPFTNWHPVKMLPVEEYCDLIDKCPPDFVKQMKTEGKCRKECRDVDDLNS